MRFVERLWTGDSPTDKAARALLSPLELVFRGIVAVRGAMYDRGVLKALSSSIPVVSIGNVTVGGTGKTPVAAWVGSRLMALGRRPAVVLRGYGGDETIVHRLLNPGIPVIEASDRVAGIQVAADGGADVAILDDAFQHRQAARDADIVLVAADAWISEPRLLPAGPYREPVEALRRASLVVITRKGASEDIVSKALQGVNAAAPGIPSAVVGLDIGEIVDYASPGRRLDVSALGNKKVLAVAAIGNSAAFVRQIEAAGARVVTMLFPDHHRYTTREVRQIAEKMSRYDYVICTLKDAVKLGPEWPAAAGPLWYVSLAVNVESGGAAIDHLLTLLASSRTTER